MKQEASFHHESLQDPTSVERLLKALTSGVAKGKIVLEDEDGSMQMEPGGLLNLKISASQNRQESRVSIRLSWQTDRDALRNKTIKISSK